MTIKIINTLLFVGLTSQACFQSFAQSSEYDKDLEYLSLTLEELGQIKVSIATGSDTPIEQAPAIASIITAEQIEAMGAKTIAEALETVPGLHISVSPVLYSPVYSFRGIRGALFTPQILMLENGISIGNIYIGDQGFSWASYPIENISRIEVIRGPGSSLYGADAYSGVINIITKTNEDFQGTKSGYYAGSFDTQKFWVSNNSSWQSIDISSFFSYSETDGYEESITSDSQTVYDNFFSTSASNAPGDTDTGYESINSHINISGEQWRFRTSINIREEIGSGAGAAQALDPEGKSSGRHITSDLTYMPELSNEDWELELQLSGMYYREKSDLVIFPAGATFPTGTFPDGVKGNPYKWERHYRFSMATQYGGLENHDIRIGTGYTSADLYRIKETKNFSSSGGAPSPLGSVVDATDTEPFVEPRKRTLKYIFLQDEWNIFKDWVVTSGVRYDDYSDFGTTVNPRAAVVWQINDAITSKLLYGEAFRAPSISEQHNQNNPVATGNSNLEPERIQTLEAAVDWSISPKINARANIFKYVMKDIIRYVPNDVGAATDNVGEQKGEGLEVELAWNATDRLRILSNYAYQNAKDMDSGRAAGLAPKHSIYLQSDWHLSKNWIFNTQINWIGKRERQPNDTREALDSYTHVNLVFRRTIANSPWQFKIGIYNLFDEEAYEPSPGPGPTTGNLVLIENDLPLAGRSFIGQISYRFK